MIVSAWAILLVATVVVMFVSEIIHRLSGR